MTRRIVSARLCRVPTSPWKPKFPPCAGAPARPERFTFHSSRMRMKHVNKDELAAMDKESDCAGAVRTRALTCSAMPSGGDHGDGPIIASRSSVRRRSRAKGAGTGDHQCRAGRCAVIMGAKKIAGSAHMKPLTELVVDYIQREGIEVKQWRALEIADNLAVARHDPATLPASWRT